MEKDGTGGLKAPLDEAQELAARMERYLAEARGTLLAWGRQRSQLQYANFCDMIQEAEKNSERLTDKMRQLILETAVDSQKYERFNEELVELHGITVDYCGGVLAVSLPALIPHRKDSYTDYVYKPLRIALRYWCLQRVEEKKEVPEYTECMLCFIHQYDRSYPPARIRDHDNYEEKQVTDLLGSFFMKSDSGHYVDTCHFTRMGSGNRTLLFVMDKHRFPEWAAKNAGPETIEKDGVSSGGK